MATESKRGLRKLLGRKDKPAAAPITPPRITESGRGPAAARSVIRAVTGRIIRERKFHTPVTMTEVEMARREKPQDRKAA